MKKNIVHIHFMQDPQKTPVSLHLQRPSTSAFASGTCPGASHTENLWDRAVRIPEVPLPRVSNYSWLEEMDNEDNCYI